MDLTSYITNVDTQIPYDHCSIQSVYIYKNRLVWLNVYGGIGNYRTGNT